MLAHPAGREPSVRCRRTTARSSQAVDTRVVIVGAGFGGLFAAKALRRAVADVTVIDRTNHHLFQPPLYQLATGILAEGDIAPPPGTSCAASATQA